MTSCTTEEIDLFEKIHNIIFSPEERAALLAIPPPPERTVWDDLSECESGGNWSINTGNGYYGGLQWKLSTWRSVKAEDDPANPIYASRERQIAAAERLHATQGFRPWPGCARKLGLL